MDKSLAVVAGLKKPNDHAEPTKVERKKTQKQTNKLVIVEHML